MIIANEFPQTMARLFQRVWQPTLIRDITILASGAALAQLIPLLALPALSRMFDPGVFAIQALLQTGIAFLLPIATGFYEFAIPIPRARRQAYALAGLVVLLSTTMAVLISVALFFGHNAIAAMLDIPTLGNWIFAYPFIIYATCLLNLSNYWLLRQGEHRLQALNRIVMAASIAAIALGCGLAGMEYGLVVGFVSGTSIGGLFALFMAYQNGLRIAVPLRTEYLRGLVHKYREFPVYGAFPAAINNLASQMPLIVIASNYSLAQSGQYAVARTLLAGGVGLLAASTGQILLKHFSAIAQRRERLWPHFQRVLGFLVAVGVTMSVGVYLLGPLIFTLYLGSGWEESAAIVRVLSFNLVLWLVAPALALVVVALRKLKGIAVWQLSYGALACCLFFFAHKPFAEFIRYVALFEALAYGLYLAIVCATMWRHDNANATR